MDIRSKILEQYLTVEAYYKTNMDFLKPEIRDYFFQQDPNI